jgi:coenzyme PQQ precursor peptide PqqA
MRGFANLSLILIGGSAKLKLGFPERDARNELEEIMEWTAPAFEEVCLNCEINSYASAKL